MKRNLARRIDGFTLIELIVTMILIGIMAFVALPRLTGLGTFDARAYADQIEAQLRFAQKSALAQRRNVRVVLSNTLNTAPALCIAANAGDACPAACATPNMTFPGRFNDAKLAITVSGAGSFCFDTLGGADATQAILFKDESGTLIRTIAVEAVTGYVHSG